MPTRNEQETIRLLYDKLTSNDPFTYVRYGDGDLLIMSDPEFNKESYHTQSPRFRYELISSFLIRDDNYIIGNVADTTIFEYNEKLTKISKELATDDKTYESAVALHRAYKDGHKHPNFLDFCKLFQKKKVLFIGGSQICVPIVKKCFNVDRFIEFPDRDAYYSLDDKMGTIINLVDDYDIIVVGIGLATRVLAGRLWNVGKKNVQFFDVGSTVDAITQRETRSWIKTHAKVTEGYLKQIEEGYLDE